MSGSANPRRPTIRDVARLAGVSHQTVSRYLRQDLTINEAMRNRIGQAIAQLDYRPNLVARAMRDRKTGRLALLLPPGTTVSSLSVLTGASSAAQTAGYVVELVTLGGSSESYTGRVLELADSGLFEGIVSLMALPQELLRRRNDPTPIVVMPFYDDHMRSIAELADASISAEIIASLARLGHRRFVHLAGDYAHTSARRRREVYLETIERLGLESAGILDCGWRAEPARQAVLDLPADSGVTAIIAANDVLATGALSGALARGWRVPEDLSVTGWDNNPVAAAMTPSMTTVDIDHERLGRRAMQQLLAALGHPEPAGDQEPIGTIVWRESTGPAATPRVPAGTGHQGLRSRAPGPR
ncbi:LacI family transcriptional regulator [Kribbella amoyensis]|uniref:LacI family transcriptional regulator n=1 Tax=Kribbella amoyensis TaxID=996641 RepID=A0A561C0L4_9ACTN|nr:LacI family DNA-binding transcriptional regulator [Kribbella amoyensis]TWD84713.1 LacI family transcriptional regulator [Kribbella amoyensis]